MGTKSTKAITLSDKDFSTKVYFPLNNGRAPGLETLAAARHLFLQHPARQHWLSHGSNSLKSVKCGKQVKVVTVPITHIRCLVPAHIPQEKNSSLLLKKTVSPVDNRVSSQSASVSSLLHCIMWDNRCQYNGGDRRNEGFCSTPVSVLCKRTSWKWQQLNPITWDTRVNCASAFS